MICRFYELRKHILVLKVAPCFEQPSKPQHPVAKKWKESAVQENSPTRLRRPSACWTTASVPWLWYYSWLKPPACPLRDLRKTERREQNDSALSVHRTADSWGWCHLGQEANRYLSAGTLSTACSPEAPLVIRSRGNASLFIHILAIMARCQSVCWCNLRNICVINLEALVARDMKQSNFQKNNNPSAVMFVVA